MTWEETILYIRTLPEYNDLVIQAYFHEDLRLNVENYMASPEFSEIKNILDTYAPNAKKILDIGCGNGITSICFALNGLEVDAVEPDPSATVGAGAIKKAADIFNVASHIHVHTAYAEDIRFPDETFDVVFARQSMHHANHLNSFVNEMARTLKKGGLFLTVRDHVVFDESDKALFLQAHPLQKFYGGENAYTPDEYKKAITLAGLALKKEIRFFDSEINYFPFNRASFSAAEQDAQIQKDLRKKIGALADLKLMIELYKLIKGKKLLGEKDVPGRMYSYIAVK